MGLIRMAFSILTVQIAGRDTSIIPIFREIPPPPPIPPGVFWSKVSVFNALEGGFYWKHFVLSNLEARLLKTKNLRGRLHGVDRARRRGSEKKRSLEWVESRAIATTKLLVFCNEISELACAARIRRGGQVSELAAAWAGTDFMASWADAAGGRQSREQNF